MEERWGGVEGRGGLEHVVFSGTDVCEEPVPSTPCLIQAEEEEATYEEPPEQEPLYEDPPQVGALWWDAVGKGPQA
jgi:hypothetical protein